MTTTPGTAPAQAKATDAQHLSCPTAEPARGINDRMGLSQQQPGSENLCDSSELSIPCQNSSPPAQEEVLSSPDLLLIILSQLPHSSLLRAQRVNRTWASLFRHAEIQAALFQAPRPDDSASYAEIHSDILMAKLPGFWPVSGQVRRDRYHGEPASVFHNFLQKDVARWNWYEIPADDAHNHILEKNTLRFKDRAGYSMRRRQEPKSKCPYRHKWAHLLVCQPPIEALELVQTVGQWAEGSLEYRTTVHCPNGLRMGLLYDSVKQWYHVEDVWAELLWYRRTGDMIEKFYFYDDGSTFKAADDKPCVTIAGSANSGCDHDGGLTNSHYDSGEGIPARVIKTDGEVVEYLMSGPKLVQLDYPKWQQHYEASFSFP